MKEGILLLKKKAEITAGKKNIINDVIIFTAQASRWQQEELSVNMQSGCHDERVN